jgi:hypothetical protein
MKSHGPNNAFAAKRKKPRPLKSNVTGLPPKAMIFVIYLCARDKVHEHNSLLYIKHLALFTTSCDIDMKSIPQAA